MNLARPSVASPSEISPFDGRDADLSNFRVSDTSFWNDHHWDLDARSHGIKPTSRRIRWCISVGEDMTLTDVPHSGLLGWLRLVVWGLLKDPGDGASPLSPNTMGNVSAGLARAVPWLVAHGISLPEHLTQSVLDSFVDDLPSLLAAKNSNTTQDDGTPDEEISHQTARNAVNIFYYIWRQRACLQRCGYAPPPCLPWSGRGASDVAEQVAECALGRIPPFPDEVAVSLLNAAMAFLDVPAQDIQNLLTRCDEAFSETNGLSLPARAVRQRAAAADFEFSTISNAATAWHSSLRERTRSDSPTSTIMLRVRELLVQLIAACCLVIQSLTGMRSSEICALKSGINKVTGLPIGVSMRLSASGVNEEFILVSDLVKDETYPRNVPWLLGSRRVGDKDLPVAVRAMLTLHRLLEPYRKLATSDRLVVGISSTQGPPKSAKGVGVIDAERLCEIYRLFAAEWVDWQALPNQSKHAIEPNDLVVWKQRRGGIITSHQPRKTFGSFILNVHPDLLPVVQRQFHHMNISITEGSYWGASTPQLQAVDSISRQLTTRALYEAIHGKTSFGGRMGKQVAANIQELRQLTEGLSPTAQWTRLSKWVDENSLEATHSPEGTCIPIVSERMECWKRAGLRPWGRLTPNFSTRTTAMCAGCPAFWIHDDALPFWRTRYVDLAGARQAAAATGRLDGSFREITRLERQAEAILRDLGVDAATLLIGD